ncbi:ATP-binding protein [Viridibacillus sp. FSL E2-0187]|uniref:PAS domain-containing sensor histidine kinase n=1 Tax=Viridibacillus TaxID=496496 RepID=UPI00187B8462|nr:PAS domain-containing sensor histidine kinase [Viridibacillus sp. JNUCC-6]QOV10630.1 PAS domain S-box protein [Viridibacillus sp. JNUCC-6]
MTSSTNPTFDYLFKEIKDPLTILDTNCKMVRINDSAKEMLAIDLSMDLENIVEESFKADWQQFIHELINEKHAACVLNLNINQSIIEGVRITGFHYTKFNVMMVRFERSTVELPTFSLLNDSEKKFNHVFNYSTNGIILTDKNGTIVEVNNQAEELLQVSRKVLLGNKIPVLMEIFHGETNEIRHFFKQLLTAGKAEHTFNIQFANEYTRYLNIVSTYDTTSELHMTVIRDDTEMMNLKQQVEHQDSLNILGELAASIAHEIRNPMTSLKGFTELLKISATEENRRYLSVIDSELERMEAILNEFLVLSKPKEWTKSMLSLSGIVTKVLELMLPNALMKNVNIVYNKPDFEPGYIYADDFKIKQVLINLIKNAIEVMPDGGEITITQTFDFMGQMKLTIKDCGSGISDLEIQKIFMPFYSTKKSGTGLGLPFVLKTIEEHGGKIEVSSELQKGTSFEITLPLGVDPSIPQYEPKPESLYTS